MKFLICDDDPVIRYLLEVVLAKRGGHEVITVSDPLEVVPTATATTPDLVLLDYVMPVRTGAEVAQDLAAEPHTASIPVVFLTGRADVSGDEGFDELGVKGIIEKPFDTTTLADRLIALIDS